MTKPNQARRIWLILGWLLVLSVIFLSLNPHPPEASFSQSDKIGHLAAYAALMGWWHQIDRNPHRLALQLVLLGLVLEILQSFIGMRQADIFDMAANTLGVGLGWFVARFAFGWSNRWLAA